MITRQFPIALSIFFAVYIIQEAVVNQFRFFGGGFSLFLIFSLIWAILSSPKIAALGGFMAGLLMDLSPSSAGLIGQWTLLMIVACYAVSYLGSGNESLSSNPLGFTFLTTVTIFFVELFYVITGALLGVASGDSEQVLITLVGIFIWSLVVTPIVLPLFSRLHAFTFNTRSAI
ncbi:MAG: rod shape-determining protein MreD [Actinomycetota bacterium]|nr:rod shape-determining protein MreD [Actinomycetota bacterium]